MALESRAQTAWQVLLGEWFTPTNWSSGVPGLGDAALIDTGFATISANTVGAAAESLTLGGTNGSVAALGINNNALFVLGMTLGRDIGSNGLITAGSGSSVGIFNHGLVIGHSGTGTISASSGADLSSNSSVILGNLPGSSGTLNLMSADFVAYSDVSMGKAGTGKVQISGGGSLNVSGNTFLGSTGGRGELSVTGVGSTFTGTLISTTHSSKVSVSTGGSISSNTFIVGPTTVDIGPGGSVIITVFTLSSASHLDFTLAGTAPGQFGTLQTANLTLDGTFTISLAPTYTPVFGDCFPIFSLLAAPSGQFDLIDLPPLAPGLDWSMADLFTTGVLRVIPEPSGSISALAILLTAAGFRRSGVKRRVPAY